MSNQNKNAKEMFIHTIYIYEGGCSGGDGCTEVCLTDSSTPPSKESLGDCLMGDPDASKWNSPIKVCAGNFVLETRSQNADWSCCSGRCEIEFEVFEERPKEPESIENDDYGNNVTFRVLSFEELKKEFEI